MKSFLILSSSSCETEIIFDVINISFNCCSDFIGVIPFFGTTYRTRISSEVFFGINTARVSIMVFLTGIISVGFGVFTGKKLSEAKHDFSWLSGIMLIILAAAEIL